jgi:hypothetical protein
MMAGMQPMCVLYVLCDMKLFPWLQLHRKYRVWLLTLCLTGLVQASDELELSSDQSPSMLIELFTSEGCSSCPPAERLLNSLLLHDELWSTYIPVAFHVDYWDYIGWRDPYAQAAHGERQSHYAKTLGQRTVYTPAFMVNGQPWRQGFLERQFPKQGLEGGLLDIRVSDSELIARYQPLKAISHELILHVAVLGMGLSTQITAGENRGRTARHEFVVVGYDTLVSANGEWQLSLPDLHYQKAGDYTLAVWVSDAQSPVPLQAVGGWLPPQIVRHLK